MKAQIQLTQGEAELLSCIGVLMKTNTSCSPVSWLYYSPGADELLGFL